MATRAGPAPHAATAGALRPLGDVTSLAVVALATVVVLATLADALGAAPLATRRGSLVVLAVVAVVVALAGLGMARESRGHPDPPQSRGTRWLARTVVAAPAVLLVGYVAGAHLLDTATRVEWFLGGDHVRHLVLVSDERALGALSYDIRPYPRGWHSSVALLWSAAGAPESSRDVPGLVSLMSTLVWLLSALLALATASLAAAVARRLGLSLLPSATAGGVAGALTLWPPFLADYQALGLESSLVAAVVLAVGLRELVERPGSRSAFGVACAGLLLMSHTWQLLLPFTAVLVLVTGWAMLRRHGGRAAVPAAAALAGAVLASAPSLLAVASDVGVGHASDADVVAPVPWVLLVAGLGAAALLAVRRRADRVLLVAVGLVVLPAVTGVALALRVGVSVATYYPAKLLWHTALLGVVLVCPLLVWGWQRVSSSTTGVLRVGLRTALALAVAGVALGAVYAPSLAFRGVWSTVDAPTVLRLLAADDAVRAQVVWSGEPAATDAVTRILLDAYRDERSRSDTRQETLTVAEDCELLLAAPDPVVLSTRPAEEVRARYACAPGVDVIRP